MNSEVGRIGWTTIMSVIESIQCKILPKRWRVTMVSTKGGRGDGKAQGERVD